MNKQFTSVLAALVLLLCGIFTACSHKPQAQKPRMVWIEVGANFDAYANRADSIVTDCRRLAAMGFTHVVVEVRPTSGDVLFKSRVAPPLKAAPRWSPKGYVLQERTAGFDYLQAFLDAGHAAGLKVFAGVNMMVGGWKAPGLEHGMVYDLPERQSWCAVDYTRDGVLLNHAMDASTLGGRFLDPANPDVQDFLLTLLEELASYQDLDGIVMDRCRFDDYALDAGYTQEAYRQFSQYIGREPERWPVFAEPGHIFLEKTPDALENQWLTFRCKVIHDFVARAVEKVHANRPNLPVGAYVGAWFSEYYRSGVNWTSPDYPLAAEEPTYSWATPAYQATGFANLVDFLLLGAYCPADNVYGDTEKTSEGYARLGRKRLGPDVRFVSGPDIGNEPGYGKGGRAQTISEIAQVMDREADGFFLFDLCYIRAFNYWDQLNL